MGVKETDWAWLAGIIDGEGYVGVRRYGGDSKPYEFVRVGMSDLHPLLRAAKITGSHPPTRPQIKPGRRPAFELAIYGRKAALVIARVYKYLTGKRLCALIAYNAYLQRMPYVNRRAPARVMRRLEACAQLSKDAMFVQHLVLPKWFVDPDLSCIL